jgi:hypothetical protein
MRRRIIFDDSYTVADLKYVCRREGISGYSRLRKAELIELTNNWFNQKRWCNNKLSSEIGANIRRFNNRERYSSRQQAIAISYSEIRRRYPQCNRIYE